MYFELRRENLPLARLHSDCGRELGVGELVFGKTAADDYRHNGRVERAIRGLKIEFDDYFTPTSLC